MEVEVQAIVWPAIIVIGLATLAALWKLASIVTELKGAVELLRAERKEVIREVIKEELKDHVESFHS